MKAPVLLKTFNHAVFPAAVIAGNELTDSSQASLLTANINFEQGIFRLEGDWHFMMTSNKHVQPEWFNYHTERVDIEANIYPGLTIDLSDDDSDGAVFVLEGNIKDNGNLATCSGLMVLDKMTGNDETMADTWNISLYIYESNNGDCEIAFKIPVTVYPLNQWMN